MRQRGAALLATLLFGLAGSGPATAAATFYTDRASWLADAGGSNFFEDFSGFAVDTDFHDAPVALDGMSIEQLGTGSFRNKVDTGPHFDHTEHDGTAHASLFHNAEGGSTPAVDVRIVFSQANLAFGFDHWVAADQEGARLEIYDGTTLLGSQDLSNDFGGFLGYVLDGGDLATSLLFTSVSSISGPGDPGEGYGIDALQGLAVPEPASLPLVGLGLATLARRRPGRSRSRRHRL